MPTLNCRSAGEGVPRLLEVSLRGYELYVTLYAPGSPNGYDAIVSPGDLLAVIARAMGHHPAAETISN